MPRRTDLKRVLIIGSGPIVIGQACEFDYSGSQACKALRAEGLEVILVNSNPATIMTDPELADRTYVEPLTPEILAAIIERERPDALLPTVGGQTALNLATDLAAAGTLEKYKVELIGASIQAIKVAEDRQLFKDAMREIGLDVPKSGVIKTVDEVGKQGGDVQLACHRMIEKTIERMYAASDENRFLEVTYASGDKEILYFKDFNSGAMIENIVRRAKKDAIKRFLSKGEKGVKGEDLFHAIRDEFKENEDLPNTTNPDDWARISGKKGERIVYVRTLLGLEGDGRQVERVSAGQYL
jgi:hypothetical protein